jgi:hypothetical protein
VLLAMVVFIVADAFFMAICGQVIDRGKLRRGD